ncbi:MAG: choice-of-anchor J domain-containing protein [Anaerolineae bacterium]
MKHKALFILLALALMVCLVPGSAADKSPRPKLPPTGPVAPAPQAIPLDILVDTLNENFDDVNNLPGWVMINHSQPIGLLSWYQGDTDLFSSQAGAAAAYIAVDYNSAADSGTVSNWLLTPELTLTNGSVLTFWTRTYGDYPDRLQVRLSTNGSSTNVGALATDVGDFTTLLLDINPTLVLSGYPVVWTQYTVFVTGITAPTTGRIAFRYFVTDGGPTGANSDYIGIDTVSYTAITGTNKIYIPLASK